MTPDIDHKSCDCDCCRSAVVKIESLKQQLADDWGNPNACLRIGDD